MITAKERLVRWMRGVSDCAESRCQTRVEAQRDEAYRILRAIIDASDGCQGPRGCNHSLTPWKQARKLVYDYPPDDAQ